MKGELKSIIQLLVICVLILMASIIYFKDRKITKQEEIIRMISKDNDIDKNLLKNDSIISKMDSIINVIYIDSVTYTNNIDVIIEENKKLKHQIWRSRNDKKYRNLFGWLEDSLKYYTVFKK